MSGSILLPISGSRESLYAMELAWNLGNRLKMAVNAQHVIDTHGALKLIGPATPGIIGSGPYVAAYESLLTSLQEIAAKLEDSYTARKEGRNVTGELFIDEGEPVDAITNRVAQHSLVVMGYHQRPEISLLNNQTVRLSLAEIFSHQSTAPLLLVQKPFNSFSELALISAVDHLNTQWIRNCMETAKILNANCSVTFLASGQHEEPPMEFVRDLKAANPDFGDLRMRMVTRQGNHPSELASHHLRGLIGEEGCLPVISTVNVGERRITGFGESPSELLRSLTFDAMLIWPEECKSPLCKNQVIAA